LFPNSRCPDPRLNLTVLHREADVAFLWYDFSSKLILSLSLGMIIDSKNDSGGTEGKRKREKERKTKTERQTKKEFLLETL
jgi:hypothetical protein